MIRTQKKSRKQRGHRTHGWGHGKKHRGAGNRGGRGNAGLGKRGAQKKTKPLSKGQKAVGRKANNNAGIKTVRNRERTITVINILDISNNLEKWVTTKKATKTKDAYSVDLTKLGYTKLLGSGKIQQKVKIKVAEASATAKSKIEKASGTLELNTQ
tara:strand:- start:32 stop:499 length:468 start_codon:yes stop_codon:yes gene_type:complete